MKDTAIGVSGGTFTMLGVITSFQEGLECGLRMAGSCVTLAIGIFTLMLMFRKWQKNK